MFEYHKTVRLTGILALLLGAGCVVYLPQTMTPAAVDGVLAQPEWDALLAILILSRVIVPQLMEISRVSAA